MRHPPSPSRALGAASPVARCAIVPQGGNVCADAEPRGEGHSGHETHEKHLRDIKASRYGPNYACNQEATQDWESFELRPTAELQSTADVQVGCDYVVVVRVLRIASSSPPGVTAS